MEDNNKSIDGLTIRRAVESRKKAVKVDNVKSTKSDKPKQVKVSKADFLEPVKVFEFDEEQQTLVDKEKSVANKETKKTTKQPKEKKKHKVRTVIITIILALVVLVLGGICYLCIWGNDIITKLTNGNGNIFEAISTLFDETYEPLKMDGKGRTNFLVFGTSGYDMSGDQGDGKPYAGSQLTDSIMVASLDQATGDIALVNIPRDLKMQRTCTATKKINEVYWCNSYKNNDEEAGATALANIIEDILGIDIQYHIHINWGSLTGIINTIGSITVTLDEDVYNFDGNKTTIKAGEPTILDANQALALARARKGTAMGDFSRGNSQQKIIIGIKDKIYESNLSMMALLNLAGVLGDNLRTNLSISELKTLAHLTFVFDFDTIRQIPLVDYNNNIYYLTTGTIDGISYVLPKAGENNYTKIQAYVQKELENNVINREAARILILNGTTISGLAAQHQTALEEKGFIVQKIGNAPKNDYAYTTIYKLSDDVSGTANELNHIYTDLDIQTELPDGVDGEGFDIVIILGENE